ncbi:MAG: matrixin family metalloprotease [Gemmatimonadota bacterium]
MKRPILPVITIALFLFIVGDRALRAMRRDANADAAAVLDTTELRSSAGGATGIRPDHAPTETSGAATSAAAARLARLAVRRQLGRDGSVTYLDSLIVTTDSLIRRWPDRPEHALTVAIVEGGTAGYRPRLSEQVREAFAVWENSGVPLRFRIVPDTATADITVRWIDRFDFDRAGQTDLTWDQLGHVRRATIALAVRTSSGFPLPDRALLSVAIHEAGHAIGLPHSADSNDVMFPATRTGALSERDRRTAVLLYQLPAGSIRDSVRP